MTSSPSCCRPLLFPPPRPTPISPFRVSDPARNTACDRARPIFVPCQFVFHRCIRLYCFCDIASLCRIERLHVTETHGKSHPCLHPIFSLFHFFFSPPLTISELVLPTPHFSGEQGEALLSHALPASFGCLVLASRTFFRLLNVSSEFDCYSEDLSLLSSSLFSSLFSAPLPLVRWAGSNELLWLRYHARDLLDSSAIEVVALPTSALTTPFPPSFVAFVPTIFQP